MRSTSYTYTFDEPVLLNHIVIQENIDDCEKVERYRIFAQTYVSGRMIQVYDGETIGHKAICSFPTAHTRKIQIVLEDAAPGAELVDVKAYYVK